MSNAARTIPATPPTEPLIVAACGVDDEDEIDGEISGEGAVASANEDATGFGRRILSAAIERADATDKADRKAEGKGTVSGFASADTSVVVVVVRIVVLLVGVDVVAVRRVVLLVDLDVDVVAVVMKVGWSGKTVTTVLFFKSPHVSPSHIQDVALGQQRALHGVSPSPSLHLTLAASGHPSPGLQGLTVQQPRL